MALSSIVMIVPTYKSIKLAPKNRSKLIYKNKLPKGTFFEYSNIPPEEVKGNAAN